MAAWVAPLTAYSMQSFSAVKARIAAGLVLAGAAAGAVAGAVLTPLGKLVAGAPPATLTNYAWNMAVFGLMAAVVSPLVTWSALRRAPLWRTVVEPLAGALVGAGMGAALGSGAAFIVLAPAGLVAAMVRLGHRYGETASGRIAAGGDAGALR